MLQTRTRRHTQTHVHRHTPKSTHTHVHTHRGNGHTYVCTHARVHTQNLHCGRAHTWVVPFTGNNVLLSSRKHTKIYLTCNADPATPSSHLRFLMIPGIQSLRDGNNMEETESKVRMEKILVVQTYGLKSTEHQSYRETLS